MGPRKKRRLAKKNGNDANTSCISINAPLVQDQPIFHKDDNLEDSLEVKETEKYSGTIDILGSNTETGVVEPDYMSLLSLEVLCNIMNYLHLRDILKLDHQCSKLNQAVTMHLRVKKTLDFTEGELISWMSDRLSDSALVHLFKRCHDLQYVHGFHPPYLSKRRQRGTKKLSIPGIIEALSVLPNLKGIEVSDTLVLETLFSYFPHVEVLGTFRNRDGCFPVDDLNILHIPENPFITSMHLIGIVIPKLPAMLHLKHVQLRYVHFINPQPFKDFAVPNLKTFVMANCAGPSNVLKYVPLIAGLAAARNLKRMELIRVPFLGGLLHHVVEESMRVHRFKNMQTMKFGACKHVIGMDVGFLAIASAENLEELYLQPSLTKDSLFIALKMATVRFPVFDRLSLGYIEPFQESGNWTNQDLVIEGLASIVESPATITDVGMKAVGECFFTLKYLEMYNSPHIHRLTSWLSSGVNAWGFLRELVLRRCHSIKLQDFCEFIPSLPVLEAIHLELMFREPPKGCSRVGLSAGTGFGMSPMSSPLIPDAPVPQNNAAPNQNEVNNNGLANQNIVGNDDHVAGNQLEIDNAASNQNLDNIQNNLATNQADDTSDQVSSVANDNNKSDNICNQGNISDCSENSNLVHNKEKDSAIKTDKHFKSEVKFGKSSHTVSKSIDYTQPSTSNDASWGNKNIVENESFQCSSSNVSDYKPVVINSEECLPYCDKFVSNDIPSENLQSINNSSSMLQTSHSGDCSDSSLNSIVSSPSESPSQSVSDLLEMNACESEGFANGLNYESDDIVEDSISSTDVVQVKNKESDNTNLVDKNGRSDSIVSNLVDKNTLTDNGVSDSADEDIMEESNYSNKVVQVKNTGSDNTVSNLVDRNYSCTLGNISYTIGSDTTYITEVPETRLESNSVKQDASTSKCSSAAKCESSASESNKLNCGSNNSNCESCDLNKECSKLKSGSNNSELNVQKCRSSSSLKCEINMSEGNSEKHRNSSQTSYSRKQRKSLAETGKAHNDVTNKNDPFGTNSKSVNSQNVHNETRTLDEVCNRTDLTSTQILDSSCQEEVLGESSKKQPKEVVSVSSSSTESPVARGVGKSLYGKKKGLVRKKQTTVQEGPSNDQTQLNHGPSAICSTENNSDVVITSNSYCRVDGMEEKINDKNSTCTNSSNQTISATRKESTDVCKTDKYKMKDQSSNCNHSNPVHGKSENNMEPYSCPVTRSKAKEQVDDEKNTDEGKSKKRKRKPTSNNDNTDLQCKKKKKPLILELTIMTDRWCQVNINDLRRSAESTDSHNSCGTSGYIKITQKKKSSAPMCSRSTSTSDPVMEDDHIQILRLTSQSLQCVTLNMIGITDLVIEDCPKLTKISAHACRVLKHVNVGNANKLSRVNFTQCKKLEENNLVKQIGMLPSQKNRVVFLRPMNHFDGRTLERNLFAGKDVDYSICVIYDHSPEPLETLYNRVRVQSWQDLFSGINSELLKNYGYKERVYEASDRYPWNRTIYTMTGYNNNSSRWELITDMPWLRPLYEAPDLELKGQKVKNPDDKRAGLYCPGAKGHNTIEDCIIESLPHIVDGLTVEMPLCLYSLIVYVNLCDIQGTPSFDPYV